MTTPKTSTNANWNGANWIRQEKRLAIYLRDGLACAWCGFSVEEGAQLSLDHLTCRSDGGGNRENNLVTSCRKCNSSRGKRTPDEFAVAVATYTESDAFDILSHVRDCASRPLKKFMEEAKGMVARRGSAKKVLDSF